MNTKTNITRTHAYRDRRTADTALEQYDCIAEDLIRRRLDKSDRELVLLSIMARAQQALLDNGSPAPFAICHPHLEP